MLASSRFTRDLCLCLRRTCEPALNCPTAAPAPSVQEPAHHGRFTEAWSPVLPRECTLGHCVASAPPSGCLSGPSSTLPSQTPPQSPSSSALRLRWTERKHHWRMSRRSISLTLTWMSKYTTVSVEEEMVGGHYARAFVRQHTIFRGWNLNTSHTQFRPCYLGKNSPRHAISKGDQKVAQFVESSAESGDNVVWTELISYLALFNPVAILVTLYLNQFFLARFFSSLLLTHVKIWTVQFR